MSDEPQWQDFGPFSICKGRLTLSAKLPYFDEEFREYARARRARWDGLAKAWVFPSTMESEVLAALHGMNLARQEKIKANENSLECIEADLKESPIDFESARISVVHDHALGKFVVKMPYDEKSIRAMRDAGGRWNSELKAHLAPLTAIDLLREMTKTPREERKLFEERNAPALLEELASPLALAIARNPGGHEIKIEAEHGDLTYKANFPFAIDSILGREVFQDILAKHHAFDLVRPQHAERMLPRVNLNSVVFEMSQRRMVEASCQEMQTRLAAMGPFLKLEIGDDAMQGRRWNRHTEPVAGEVIFDQHKAWLIAKAARTKNKLTLRVHPLTAQEAIQRLSNASATSQRRACDMSGIDFAAYDSYIEALLMREAAEQPGLNPSSKKSPRL